MILLDGKKLQSVIVEELKTKVLGMQNIPSLVVVQVGDNPVSNIYIRMKIKFGEKIGVPVQVNKFESDISTEALLNFIDYCNQDTSIGGVIVQLPLPYHLDKMTLLNAIDPRKDVDGLGEINSGKLVKNDYSGKIPATPKGVISLLKFYGLNVEGKKAIVIGRSQLVGLPLSILLAQNNATVTVVHSHTENIPEICRDADFIFAACGCPKMVNSSFLKPGAVIVDIGITNVDGKNYGDVDFEDVKNIVSAISPVPGGVGPMTVASLFENLLN